MPYEKQTQRSAKERMDLAIKINREESLEILTQVVYKEYRPLHEKEMTTEDWKNVKEETVKLFETIKSVQFIVNRDAEKINIDISKEEQPF